MREDKRLLQRCFGAPVTCGGVEVHNGDIEVLEKAIQKLEKEQHIVEQLLAGKTTLEIYGFHKLIVKPENL